MAYSSQRLAQVGLNAEVAAKEAAAVNQQLALVDSHLAAGHAEQAHDAIAVLMKQIEEATAEQRLAIATPKCSRAIRWRRSRIRCRSLRRWSDR